ncbi:MAG: phosphodiester glycosidase family protein [Nanoarchaeota archaeon]|nr:phosphodiester glycosidase family protein [Nanoarchaeota archaeon]
MIKYKFKMIKKPSTFLFICLLIISLLLISCGGDAPESSAPTEPAEEPAQPAEEPETSEIVYQISSPQIELHYNEEGEEFSSDIKVNTGFLKIGTLNAEAELEITRSFYEVINTDFARMKAIEGFFQDYPDGCMQINTYDGVGGIDVDFSLFSDVSCQTGSLVKSFTIEQIDIEISGDIGQILLDGDVPTGSPTDSPTSTPASQEFITDPNVIPSAERAEKCNNCMETRFQMCSLESCTETGFQRTDLFTDFIEKSDEVHKGVYYRYQELIQPRVMNIHTLRIDLDNVNFVFRGKPTSLQTTGNFLKDNGADIAVNSGAASLVSRAGLWTTHLTVAISDSEPYSTEEITGWSLVEYNADNEELLKDQYYNEDLTREEYLKVPRKVDIVHVDETNYDDFFFALGGFHQLVWDNEIIIKDMFVYKEDTKISADARVTFGLDMENNILIIIVVEGDDTKGKGMDLPELGCLNYCHGATRAINMDGGTSTTLVFKDPSSTDENFVWDFKYSAKDPNYENSKTLPDQRPASTHLGIRFKE